MDIHDQGMFTRVREELIRHARRRETITYKELCDAVGIAIDLGNHQEANALSALLGELSDYEHAQGRPLLSVLVVKKDTQRPGGGFFGLAGGTGKYDGGSDRTKQEAFFIKELNDTFTYWRSH